MKTLFRSLNLWRVREQGFSTSGTKAQQLENKKDDAMALYLIQ